MAGGSVADLDYWRLTRSSASDAASVPVALVEYTLCNSTATEAVPVLVGLHQQVKDLGQPKVRRLHVRHLPSGKRRLDLASARASYERASALWPHEQQHSCIGRGNRRTSRPIAPR